MADKEKHFILIEGKLVEVEKKVYVDYYRMNRRERYLEERDKDNGVFSYDALDGDGRKGEELFPDPKIESVEALALSQELMRQLHKGWLTLIFLYPKAISWQSSFAKPSNRKRSF